ncbi:MAG: biopolymer transporter ExbD [Myxococcaceae bacterium]|jgi:biopolymer transport protein TolR|nr:biopolymer transporter ExbD [Myxococcaceae bacterium]MDX2011095.1 biopolymer transporter ExbD [Myxococcaceae bacterium]
MAGGMDLGGGGKGGKKPLDTNINLVPFIDLMAVTIVFLIMTAVWTQLGRLQVSQSGQSAQEEQPQENKPPPPSLLITEKELKLSVGGLQYDPIPIVKDEKGRLDLKKLLENLGKVKTEQPDQASITLQTEDNVLYEDLVRIIDACIGAQFPSVSVSPASS